MALYALLNTCVMVVLLAEIDFSMYIVVHIYEIHFKSIVNTKSSEKIMRKGISFRYEVL